jgi:hypothetical protein
MATVSSTNCELSFTAVIGCRGYHVYRESSWKYPSLTDKLSLRIEAENVEDPCAVAIILKDCPVGHIPREISRHVFWFLKLGGKAVVKLRSIKLYQSPIALKGLELLLDVTFLIDPSKHLLLKRLKDHIDTNYAAPKEEQKSKKSDEDTEQRAEELTDSDIDDVIEIPE